MEEVNRKDILAACIALYQLLLPVIITVIIGLGLFTFWFFR